jgi:hypothetical protein
MVEIRRFWNWDEVPLMYKRPRIDYKISEYVFDYININILKQKNIMQTGDYDIHLLFFIHNEEAQNKEDKFYKHQHYRSRKISIMFTSTKLHEKITPIEYANIVYDMIGFYLTNKYKKITKEIMDKNKNGMDYNYIENLNYPAVYEDQKYIGDEKENKREEYKKYYNEKSKEEKEKYRKYFNE